MDKLKEVIWKKLELIRVFLKPKDGEADKTSPLVLKKNATVLEAAQKISHELASEVKGAKIFGRGAFYQGQNVGLSYPLKDGLIITFL